MRLKIRHIIFIAIVAALFLMMLTLIVRENEAGATTPDAVCAQGIRKGNPHCTVHPTATPRPAVSCSVKPTRSPYASPTVSPSPTPESTTTSSPSAEPTSSPIVRTDLTDGRSDNRGCSVNDCSGNKIPTKEEVLAAESTASKSLPQTGSQEGLVYYIGVSLVSCFGVLGGLKLRRYGRDNA